MLHPDLDTIDDLGILRRSKSEIMSTEGRNLGTKNRCLDELLKAGILDLDGNSKKERIYSLSEYGQAIAVHLDAIYEIIKLHDS